VTRFDEASHSRDRAGRFAAHQGSEQEGSLADDDEEAGFEMELAREEELFGDSILGQDPGWTWTALASRAGRERAAELYRASGGSIGTALAMYEPHRRAEDLRRSRDETPATAPDTRPSWDDGDEPRPVTDLTAREGRTLRGLSTARLVAVRRELHAGPEDGFRETGPEMRAEIVRQIGDRPFGNLSAISGGRVIPLPDGIELPVSNGYSVRVRLAGNDTYTVQRIFTRAGRDSVKGERTDVYFEDVGQAAYYASCFRSHSQQEWVTAI
jgi:hypothetical protein